ncbi:menaquinone biosynthetic enzyme MqnA/MqnD family protein [Paenibacillus methanolicus]|uniref:Chorismate dehydratase n=1 Tax=Paenibacillus methanolicus TaxID=582686 RepID=A0A5S5CIC7_9BACL|nr:menaquinone biosynthesis protein [Paenibacillus methanolicus]TYP77763.1 chorismate dehydratase [Paenibacillus methanolicus]
MGLQRPITIGRIDYANAWPLFHFTDQTLPEDRFTIVKRVPSLLNQAMRKGELDLTAMAAFAYAQHADDYLLLPDLSVSARGRVNSILLFLKAPLEDVLNGGTIAVTNTSATSINLLKIIMGLYYEASPVYVTTEPNLDAMLEHADAALLIGDPAIQSSWDCSGLTVLDLGELWRSWTGFGMTFALVAVRKEVAAAAPAEVAAAWKAMTDSKRESLRHPEVLVDKACRELGGTPEYWSRYFRELHHDFGPDEQAGLALYFEYAHRLGLLENRVQMNFFEAHSALQVNE